MQKEEKEDGDVWHIHTQLPPPSAPSVWAALIFAHVLFQSFQACLLA